MAQKVGAGLGAGEILLEGVRPQGGSGLRVSARRLRYDPAMQSKAATVAEYLAALPDDRRAAIKAIRAVIRKNLPKGYKEGMQYGMIGYFVPHSVYPAGYHCDPSQPVPFASLASQKNHIGIYLFCIYTDNASSARFQEEWRATGKRLDMGKSCVRVKKLEDVPLDVVGRAVRVPVKTFIESYESNLGAPRSGKRSWTKKDAPKKKATGKAAKKKTAKKRASKKKAAKKSVRKKSSKKKPPVRRATR